MAGFTGALPIIRAAEVGFERARGSLGRIIGAAAIIDALSFGSLIAVCCQGYISELANGRTVTLALSKLVGLRRQRLIHASRPGIGSLGLIDFSLDRSLSRSAQRLMMRSGSGANHISHGFMAFAGTQCAVDSPLQQPGEGDGVPPVRLRAITRLPRNPRWSNHSAFVAEPSDHRI